MYTKPPRRGDIGNVILWGASIAVVLAVLVVLGFALDWFAAPFTVMSSRSVQTLSRQANDTWQGLQAQKATISTQRGRLSEFRSLYGENAGAWPQGKRQEYEQLSAAARNLVAAYNQQCGQYNALWQDEWRDLPAPDDLPKHCELLTE